VAACSIPDLMPWRPGVVMNRSLLDDSRWHLLSDMRAAHRSMGFRTLTRFSLCIGQREVAPG